MPSEHATRPPGRFRAALAALMGAPVVPSQIRAEWSAWALELEALCDKITAAAARLQSRHKRELDRVLEELEDYKAREADVLDPMSYHAGGGQYSPAKRALNRQVLAMKGVQVPGLHQNGEKRHVAGAEAE